MNSVEEMLLLQLRTLLIELTESVEPLNEKVLSELLALSAEHSVTPLVAESLSRQGCLKVEGAAEAYRQVSYFAFIKWQQQEMELGKITALFEKNGISNIPLKGAVLRKFYPEPWMRTSCDLDILVREEQLGDAERMLIKELGYEKKTKTGHDVMFLTQSGVNIELHYGFDEPELILEKMWETASVSTGQYQFALSVEWFILHHISHMAKHFSIGGCGIRSLIDLWLILKNMPCDNALLEHMLLEAKLDKFYDEMCKLVTGWMEGNKLSDLQAKILEYIITGGTYGSIENRVTVGQSQREKNALQILFRRIFLSRDSLARMYPMVRKHLILYPFCQIHRWIKVLRVNKIKSMSNELEKAQNVGEKVLDATREMLEELGLSKH